MNTLKHQEPSLIRIGKNIVDRDLFLFLAATALCGVGVAVSSTSLTNRLSEIGVTVMERSWIEFFREFTGIMTVFLVNLLFRFGDVRISAISFFVSAVGMTAFGLVPPTFAMVSIALATEACGLHLFMPTQASISMNLGRGGRDVGRRLGNIQLANSVGVVGAALFYLFLYAVFDVPFQAVYLIGAAALVAGGLLLLRMNPDITPKAKRRMTLRRRYTLFYILSFISGARKQITFTFVTWLIVKIYGQPVTTMALLFVIVSACNLFFRPMLGALIDRKGERFILIAEGALMLFLSLGFGFAGDVFHAGKTALIVVCFFYVTDNLLLNVSMARATYVFRIADDPADVSPTLSMGITIEHITAVSLTLGAGLLWNAFGYRPVFVFGAGISLLNLVCAFFVRVPENT